MKYILGLNHGISYLKDTRKAMRMSFQSEQKLTTSPFLTSHKGVHLKWSVICFPGWSLIHKHKPVGRARLHFCLQNLGDIVTGAWGTSLISLGLSKEKSLDTRRGKEFQVHILKLKVVPSTLSTQWPCPKSEKQKRCNLHWMNFQLWSQSHKFIKATFKMLHEYFSSFLC